MISKVNIFINGLTFKLTSLINDERINGSVPTFSNNTVVIAVDSADFLREY